MQISEAFKISKMLMFGSVITALNIMNLIYKIWHFGLPSIFVELLEDLDDTLNLIFTPLQIFFELCISLLDLNIEFNENWKTIFSILALKIAFDLRVDLTQKRYIFSLIELIVGIFCFGVASILTSNSKVASIFFGLPVIFSMIAYELIRSIAASLMYIYPNQSFFQRFIYRQKHYTGVVLLSGGFALFVQIICAAYNLPNYEIIGFLFFIFFIGLFSVADAAIVALKSSDSKMKVFISIQRRGLGLALIYSYFIAVFFIFNVQVM